MNAIQKAAFAAGALAITLLGAALVTAPMAFARPVPLAVQADGSAPATCPGQRLLISAGEIARVIRGAPAGAGVFGDRCDGQAARPHPAA